MKRLAFVICALGIAVPSLAQDASGKWQITVTTPQREPRTTSMVLKKDGEKLSGTLIGPQEVELALTGTQTGADVTLSFTVSTQNGPLAVSLKGRQDGESMKGTLEIGPEGQGEWTAARTAAPAASPSSPSAIDVTGTWALQVETPAGSGSPIVTLKQEGEKVTGLYKGRLGEAPVAGRMKGNALTFEVKLTLEGTDIVFTYNGTVEQNAMKGTVRIGDLGEGTFTGKKQEANSL